MTTQEANGCATALTNLYGIAVSASLNTDQSGQIIEFRPTDLDRNEGFAVAVRVGWRSIEASYMPGAYSAPFIAALGQATDEQKNAFRALAQAALDQGAKIRMLINTTEVSASNPAEWPQGWKAFSLSLKRSPVEIVTESDQVAKWGGRLLGMVLCLAPSEEVKESSETASLGLPEGARTTVEVNRYERSRTNRAICIDLKGTTCCACGFDFGKQYGTLGAGFIHVHHVVPVSRLGQGYIIDPAKDLVPICPNCHAMAHRTDPPIPVDELKRIVETIRLQQTR